jgi:oxepin-CoA hydrolase/3-oxo-5,6-dehydrosuberyl-CoA semialdehyde dehydrogenase
MGPLATASQLEDVRKGVEKLCAESEVVFGDAAGREGGPGYFYGPVLLQSRDTKASRVVHEHEVFGPVATLLPWDGDAAGASELVARGKGSLVASLYSDDREFHRALVLEVGPWHGRLYLGSEGMAGQSLGPGTFLPGTIHGGPGRAGGGEELGGFRGMALYQQRVALQGDRAVLEKIVPKA